MARDKSAGKSARPVPLHLVPTATGFDFLEGTFRASERARQVFLTFALALVAGVGGLILLGVYAAVGASSDQSTLTGLQSQQTQLNQQIVARGGSSLGQAAARVKDRQAAIKDAIGGEVDVPTLLKDVQAATPAGVTVTNITVGSSAATTPTAGATPAPSASPTPAPTRQLSVTATLSDLSQVPVFQAALQGLPQLSNVMVKWSGNVPNLTVTVNATITDNALSARAQQAVRDAGATTRPTTPGSH